MAYTFRVRLHPLGVIVFRQPDEQGELLLPGEECCGVSFDELVRIAKTTREVEVADATAAASCPLQQRH